MHCLPIMCLCRSASASRSFPIPVQFRGSRALDRPADVIDLVISLRLRNLRCVWPSDDRSCGVGAHIRLATDARKLITRIMQDLAALPSAFGIVHDAHRWGTSSYSPCLPTADDFCGTRKCLRQPHKGFRTVVP
jgi:hypothetical protein